MKILTAAQMESVDRRSTEEIGIPSLILMENAGMHLFRALQESFSDLANQSIGVVCGKGNNGGDGLVLARQLIQHGIPCDVFLLAKHEDVKGDAAVNLEILLQSDETVYEIESEEVWREVSQTLEVYDILVDALLGTGITKPLRGLYARVVEDINHAPAFVLAVDIPSGMVSDDVEPSELSIWADRTVTFTAPKIAHILNEDQEALGALSIVPIGTPSSLLESEEFRVHLLTKEQARVAWLPRRASSHKGTFGHVALVAGSRGKGGAAALASQAALRGGSGLVTVLAPDPVLDLIASFQKEVMTRSLAATREGTFSEEATGETLEILEDFDAAGIGPGLTTHSETVRFTRDVVEKASLPLVIDADGLNALQDHLVFPSDPEESPRVLTPHPGEFARLSGREIIEIRQKPLQLASEFAQEHGVWVILKLFRGILATPRGELFVSPRGNAGMATAGTGDVLTGLVTSLLGQYRSQGRNSPDETSRAVGLALYLHGLAGDLALLERTEESLIAGDIIDSLAEAFDALFHSTVRSSTLPPSI